MGKTSKVLVLGGGTAGTWVANRLHRARGGLEITVVDSHGDHLFQPGFIPLVFNDDPPESLERDERRLLDTGVELRVARVSALDTDKRTVGFEDGTATVYDALVVATGSRNDPAAVPGLKEGTRMFHCRRHAVELREALRAWTGGRIVVGAARLPYRCPPSPHEFALLLDERLRRRGLREKSELTFVYPAPRVFDQPAVADFFEPLFKARGISWIAPFTIDRVDVENRRLASKEGTTLDCDLAVIVPPHTGARFLRGHPLATPDGWVNVDPHTLRAGPGVYAVGDAANLTVGKSGGGAHAQAKIVVENVLAELAGREPVARYDGRVT